MNRLPRLASLDRRWIFLAIGLVVALPFFQPIGFPIRPSKETTAFYQTIEELTPGSTVYLAADYDPGTLPELQPMLETAIRQLCRKRVKIIAGSLWPACPPLVDRALREIAVGEFSLEEGVDFVNLGFKEGRELVMVQLGEDLPAVYPVDIRGRTLGSLPVAEGIRNLESTALLISISAGYPGTKEWVQQVRSRFRVPVIAGCTAVSAPEYLPYFQSGQLSGLLGGLAGAAEYETLLGVSAGASLGMDSQSLGHLAVVALILLGNLTYLLGRGPRGGR